MRNGKKKNRRRSTEETMLFEDSEGVPVPREERSADGRLRKPDGKSLFDIDQAHAHFGMPRGRLAEIWLRSLKREVTTRAMDIALALRELRQLVDRTAEKAWGRRGRAQRAGTPHRRAVLARQIAAMLSEARSELSLELFVLAVQTMELRHKLSALQSVGKVPAGAASVLSDLASAANWLSDAECALDTASHNAAGLHGITLASFTKKRPVRKESAGK